MAVHFPEEAIEQKYGGTTILATDRILNPVSAILEALDIYRFNHMQEPTRNASFRIIWFLQKNGRISSQTFVVLQRLVPSELKYTYLWNCRLLEDVFGSAQGNYLETKDSLNIVMFQSPLHFQLYQMYENYTRVQNKNETLWF